MNDEPSNNGWSLEDLNEEYYAQFGIRQGVIKAITDVIESILNPDMDPEARLRAYQVLDKRLQGKDRIYRTPVVLSLAGSRETLAAVTNGCGPAWLGSLPDGPWQKCCDEHDRCYDEGGGVAAKLICDAAFYRCLWGSGLPIIAEIFAVAVLLFGWFSFDWNGDDEPPPRPNPCTGPCSGTERRITNLRNFQTVGRSVAQVLLNHVPRGGRAALEAEAEELSEIEWRERCNSDCRCNVSVAGGWQRNTTFLTVPANNPDSHVNYHCQATIWKREISGTCE